MSKNLTSTRRQLLYSFFSLTFIFLIGLLLAYLFFKQSNEIRQFRNDLAQVHFKITRLFNSEMGFMLSEENDVKFHESRQSEVLKNHQTNQQQLIKLIETMQSKNKIFYHEFDEPLDSLQDLLHQHNLIFQDLVAMVQKRGFKDFGLVGTMRAKIHQLEKNPGQISMASILSLRRHEKDFLLRDDSVYMLKLNLLTSQLLGKLKNDSVKNANQINTLRDYRVIFNQIAKLNFEIGGFLKEGKMLNLQKSMELTEAKLDVLENKAVNSEDKLSNTLHITLMVAFSGLFIFSIIFSIRMAKVRAKPIKKLASAINDFSLNTQQFFLDLRIPTASKEIQELLQSFNNLLKKLEQQLQITEEKSATLEKQNLELNKVNEELDKFVYSVSHDLRAPLLSILGLINISKKETDLQQVKELMTLQEKSINKLDNFISDIINLSRNARLEVSYDLIDWQKIVESSLEQQQFLPNFNLIKFNIKVHVPQDVYCDRMRLQTIFNNLISNAIRYSNLTRSESQVTIQVETIDGKAIIKIADNGIGIKEEHISKIFNMFYRAHDFMVGSGLGLYICKETVQKMNGEIKVTSKLGQGTEFTVSVPVLVEDAMKASRNTSMADKF